MEVMTLSEVDIMRMRMAVIMMTRTLAITLMAITMSVLAPRLLRGTRPCWPPVGVTFGSGCQGVTPELLTRKRNWLAAGWTPGASSRYWKMSVLLLHSEPPPPPEPTLEPTK